MPIFTIQGFSPAVALVVFYLPHAIFLLYKIGQSLFSPTTKLYLYHSVCHDRHDEILTIINSLPNYNNGTSNNNFTVIGNNNNSLSFDCQFLPDKAENFVQQSAADYIMAMKILQDVPAFILGMFCGSWIDRVGRRLPMLMSCLGGTIVAVMFTFIQIAGVMALPAIFVGIAVNSLTGRNTMVTMAIQAYVADQTVEDERTRQLGFLLAMNFFGLFFGSLIMALMSDFLPFWAMFLCVAILYSLAFILILFALPEKKKLSRKKQLTCCHCSNFGKKAHHDPPSSTLKMDQITAVQIVDNNGINNNSAHDEPTRNFAKTFAQCCRIDNFTDTIKTLTRKRPKNMRFCLILTYLCVVLQNMCKAGEVDVLLLFLKHTPFSWSEAWYGYLLSGQYATAALLLLVFLPFLLKNHRLSDSSIIIGSTVVKTIGLALMAFSDRSWMIFVASVLISTFGIIISCMRSIISKIVDEDEYGKCFALIAASETVSDLVGGVVFIPLYNVGLSFGDIGRSLPFLVIVFIHLILLGIAIFVKISMDKPPKQDIEQIRTSTA